MKKLSRNTRILLVIALVALATAATYAFTASNTVPGSNAGSGSGAISGYTVSNIHYQANAATPDNMDAVTFDLDAPANDVKVTVVNGGQVYDCGASVGGSNSVSCDTTVGSQASISAANNLTVVAVS
jgi:hypothetical protein